MTISIRSWQGLQDDKLTERREVDAASKAWGDQRAVAVELQRVAIANRKPVKWVGDLVSLGVVHRQ